MKTFTHSGHLGDVLYSLPAVKILAGNEGAIMYVKEIFEDHRGHINGNTGTEGVNYTQFDAIKDLLLLQPYIKEVIKFVPRNGDYSPGHWPRLQMDYDLDKSRGQNGRRFIFHVKRYFDTFGITEDWKNHIPWLTIDEEPFLIPTAHEKAFVTLKHMNYAIFHITDRWHGFLPDWQKIYRRELHKYDKIYFTGYRSDYEKFEKQYSTLMDYLPTNTLLDLARVVRDAQAVYCNQNCCLVLAQSMGKKYYLARNADRTHCHTGLLNENLI